MNQLHIVNKVHLNINAHNKGYMFISCRKCHNQGSQEPKPIFPLGVIGQYSLIVGLWQHYGT